MVRRSVWPLLAAITLTTVIGVGSFATRETRVAAHRPGPTPSSAPTGLKYVAIGDSFTAGGPIGALQAGTGSCLRSTRNYPSLVARRLGYTVVDVSCFGATTRTALSGRSGAPAQISALDDTTDVVTVSIGGNDLGIYSTMLLTCMRTSRTETRGAPCQSDLQAPMRASTATIGRRVGELLRAIETRAPRARVIVITYLSLMPHGRSCSAVPFSARDVAWFAGVEDALATSVVAAARDQGVDVLDMHARSRAHSLCGTSAAWVNGARPEPGNGILFHPNAAGERAVATAVIDLLRR